MDLGTTLLILWFGGFLVFEGSMTVGELVAFQFYWTMMNNAYQGLQGLMVQFTQSAAAAEKVFLIWDNKPDIEKNYADSLNKEAVVDWNVVGKLTLDNVTFRYQMRPDNVVLDKLSLEIPGGGTCALVGRSGGGKSTIIRLLLRFYDPQEGQIKIDDKNYAELDVRSLRKHFGCVAQKTTLFAKSMLYNITYGLDPSTYTMEDVIEACKKAQCYDFIMQFKDKFETRAGEAGLRISGGQGQRIAIARVFLRKPKIILLDEATSALDEASQKHVQDALSLLLEEQGSTVVVVAHRLTTVKAADTIAVIDKGVVLEQGSHDELMGKHNGVYRSLVTLDETSTSEGANKNEGVEELMEKVLSERDNKT